MSDFLGQDLLQEALKERSLDVFDTAIDYSHNVDVPLINRVDAFRAAHFGLAGIILHGWKEKIVEPAETPVRLNDKITLAHQFSSEAAVPPHNWRPISSGDPEVGQPLILQNQGEFALTMVRHGLVRSMTTHLSEAGSQHRGIKTASVIEKIANEVNTAKATGLTKVPDVSSRGEKLWEGFGYLAQIEDALTPESVKAAINNAASNPIRLTRKPIEKTMEHYENHSDNQAEAVGVLHQIMTHASRSSQGHAFNGRAVDAKRPTERGIRIITNDKGEAEATWQRKYAKPFRRLAPNEEIPKEDTVLVAKRNKCPMGYTEFRGQVMPLAEIYEAILLHLVQNDLHIPSNFMKPKELYYDPML